MFDAHPSNKPLVKDVNYLFIARVKDGSVEEVHAHVRKGLFENVEKRDEQLTVKDTVWTSDYSEGLLFRVLESAFLKAKAGCLAQGFLLSLFLLDCL